MGRQHAEALHDHPEVDLVAVADLRGQVAEEVGAWLDSMPFSDYEEMLKSHSFDLLVTATPDPLHRDPVIAAIQAAVPNLVVEKPFATNMADANAMYEAAERKGSSLFVMFANRSRPLDIATRYVVRQGLVGRVVYGEVRVPRNGPGARPSLTSSSVTWSTCFDGTSIPPRSRRCMPSAARR